jgi:hypothetical protein
MAQEREEFKIRSIFLSNSDGFCSKTVARFTIVRSDGLSFPRLSKTGIAGRVVSVKVISRQLPGVVKTTTVLQLKGRPTRGGFQVRQLNG